MKKSIIPFEVTQILVVCLTILLLTILILLIIDILVNIFNYIGMI